MRGRFASSVCLTGITEPSGLARRYRSRFQIGSPLKASSLIDFESQAAARGHVFTGIADSPLVIGMATFTGGELLNAATAMFVDETGVYASSNAVTSMPGYTNPLTNYVFAARQ